MKQVGKNPFNTPALLMAALFSLYMVWGVWERGASSVILLVSVTMSVITFAMYGKDKFAATHNQWRIRESALHIAALLGGWPGAALGQIVFHHKSSKLSFRTIYWVTVIANVIVVSYLML